MSDALLTLLKWCLLALMYLFFFRVLQATWFSTTGSRGVMGRPRRARSSESAPTSSGRGQPAVVTSRRSAYAELVFTEPAELAGTVHQVNGTLTIGRAAGCEITLDDTYISQVHARVSVGESGVVVEDLGSTNGTYLNRRRVSTPVVVSEGDVIQVGSTTMELR